MTRAKRNKYLAAIGVCSVALLADRLFLPQQAPAFEFDSTISHSAARNAAAAADAMEISSWPIPEVPFPRGITPLSDVSSLRDPFFVTGKSKEGQRQSKTDDRRNGAGGTDGRDEMSAERFASEIKLTGLMVVENRKLAIVGTHWLEPGQSLHGCALKSITGTEALFECYDGEARLSTIISRDGGKPGE